jgi:hypothetical protein
LGAINVQGTTIPDETAYRFQARILAGGHLVAAPPPGATNQPEDVPLPLHFNHTVLWRWGWFAKYPLGWPLVLALPEQLGFAWVVNPLLSAAILVCTFWIGRMIAGPMVGSWAVALLALSPAFLAPSVMLMSHALAGVMVVVACGCWLEGTRRLTLSPFAFMWVLVALTFHVRPFTALLVTITLFAATVLALWHERGFLARVLSIGIVIGALMTGSMMLYDWAFTGNAWLSPYALYNGVTIPVEISASVPQALRNIGTIWRFSAQSTLTFFFPLIPGLAAVGFWKNRKTCSAVWLLLPMVVVIVLGHLVETGSSGSALAERYWFEAYFAVAILGARGVEAVLDALGPTRRALIAVTCALAAVQLMVSFAAARIILQRSAPSRAVARLGRAYSNCRCVVFLKSSPESFYGEHLNLNGPDWEQANVFYAVDPGPEQRLAWTRKLRRDRFFVITYDPETGAARQEP